MTLYSYEYLVVPTRYPTEYSIVCVGDMTCEKSHKSFSISSYTIRYKEDFHFMKSERLFRSPMWHLSPLPVCGTLIYPRERSCRVHGTVPSLSVPRIAHV